MLENRVPAQRAARVQHCVPASDALRAYVRRASAHTRLAPARDSACNHMLLE